MTQYARPISDGATDGQWENELHSTSNMYQSIDEVVADDLDFMQAAGTGLGGDVNEYYADENLGVGTDPAVQTGHILRVRARQFNNISLKVKLQVGGVDILSSVWVVSITTTETLYSLTLTSAEVDAFRANGGYAGCTVRLIRPGVDTADWIVRVTQAYLEYPDAGYAHLDIDGPGLKVVAANSGNYLVSDGPGLRRVAGLETPGSGALVHDGAGWRTT